MSLTRLFHRLDSTVLAAAVPVAVPAVAARQVRAAAVARPVSELGESRNNKPKPECSALLSAPTNKSNSTQMDSVHKKFVIIFFIHSIFMAIVFLDMLKKKIILKEKKINTLRRTDGNLNSCTPP
jgi:hypothetical protein